MGFYPPRREKTRPGAGTGQALGSRGTTPTVPYIYVPNGGCQHSQAKDVSCQQDGLGELV